MVLELLIAVAVTAGSVEPPAPDVPLHGQLPNGGHACLVIQRCDSRPCVVPVQRVRPPLPHRQRCGPRAPKPRPHVIPAATK